MAFKLLNKSIGLDKKNYAAYNSLGIYYLKALEIYPNNSLALNLLKKMEQK